MDAATTIRRARTSVGLSLRELARRAGTSHATIAAYESGTKCPTVATLDRIVEAAGYALDADLQRRHDGATGADPTALIGEPLDRGAELEAVLGLAEAFPARHDPKLRYPIFPPVATRSTPR